MSHGILYFPSASLSHCLHCTTRLLPQCLTAPKFFTPLLFCCPTALLYQHSTTASMSHFPPASLSDSFAPMLTNPLLHCLTALFPISHCPTWLLFKIGATALLPVGPMTDCSLSLSLIASLSHNANALLSLWYAGTWQVLVIVCWMM